MNVRFKKLYPQKKKKKRHAISHFSIQNNFLSPYKLPDWIQNNNQIHYNLDSDLWCLPLLLHICFFIMDDHCTLHVPHLLTLLFLLVSCLGKSLSSIPEILVTFRGWDQMQGWCIVLPHRILSYYCIHWSQLTSLHYLTNTRWWKYTFDESGWL